MATLTKQQIVSTGLEATFSAASAGGDVAPNDGFQFLHVVNADASDTTVTITRQKTTIYTNNLGTETLTDRTVVCTAGEERYIGPFHPDTWNNSSGQVAISYSNTTSVTVAWLEFNPNIT